METRSVSFPYAPKGARKGDIGGLIEKEGMRERRGTKNLSAEGIYKRGKASETIKKTLKL